jgi:hypothetical protein
MQHELESAGQVGLERGQADFAVALHGMTVAGGEIRARHENRQIERGADEKFLVVHVAAELARFDRAARPVVRPRRHRQNSEEGSQSNRRAPWQRTGHRLPIDRDDAAAKLRIVFRERAAQRADQIPAPVDGQRYVLDTHLEGIARLGAAHGHGPGQDVRTR